MTKLTTNLACKVAGLDRYRFNEAVASGFIECAPPTVAGRTRHFERTDMLLLWFYRELLEAGYSRERAGKIACALRVKAEVKPDAPVLAYVERYGASPVTMPAEDVPQPKDWAEALISGHDIRRVTFFNIAKTFKLIDHATNEAISTFGAED